jgi:hypothetical protein
VKDSATWLSKPLLYLLFDPVEQTPMGQRPTLLGMKIKPFLSNRGSRLIGEQEMIYSQPQPHDCGKQANHCVH